MKIENRGIEITDVPGINRITTGPSPYGDGTMGATIVFMAGGELYLEAPGLTELIDALQTAYAALVGQSASANPEQKSEPRVFSEGMVIPADVRTVRDGNGDLWYRDADGVWTCEHVGPFGERSDWTTGKLIRSGYSPVTEVRP